MTLPAAVAAETTEMYPGDIKSVLISSDEIQSKVAELGAQLGAEYRDALAENGQDLLLITVLKGAVFFVTDLARAIPLPTQRHPTPANVTPGRQNQARAISSTGC